MTLTLSWFSKNADGTGTGDVEEDEEDKDEMCVGMV